MTITLNNVELLLARELQKRKDNLEFAKEEIETLESRLEKRKEYVAKLSFYIDKFSKIGETIEMDKKNKKPFEEIHSNLFPPASEEPEQGS